MMSDTLTSAPLGKRSAYITHYDASLLFPIPRAAKRDEINIPTPIPFHGFDVWHAYELSWLNPKGKPSVAIATFIIPCTSSHIIESKSLKLYLNSFNQTHFETTQHVIQTLQKDLSEALRSDLTISLTPVEEAEQITTQKLSGTYLDNLDIQTNDYTTNSELLMTEPHHTSETIYSHLLKSNCLVTGQPDWASIEIQYTGTKINHESLLKYIVSFRNHNEFHEQCVERIFMDIMRVCTPEQLTVIAHYTRRGGLDINPYRSTQPIDHPPKQFRLIRQ